MEKRFQLAHRFITVTTLIFIAEIVAIHFLYTERTFCSNNLSIYALGRYWYLITSGFLFCAMNYVLMAALYWQAGDHASRGLRFGVYGLLSLSLVTLVIAAFPADFGPTVSACGWTHEIAAYLHFMILPLAALGLCSGLKDAAFRSYNRLTRIFAFVLIAIGLLIVGDNFMPEDYHMAGVLQKSLILLIEFWVLYSSRILITAIERESMQRA